MARLQDFQTVTPSDSDNLLVVQATGQGLATVGSTLGAKMDKANPTGTGSLSLNRKSGTTEGGYSVATGYQATASGGYSQAGGYRTVAAGTSCSAFGTETIANHAAQHVFGMYNLADTSTAAATSKGNYIEIVGKGTSDSARSNARTLDWSGNEVLAGDCTIMGNKSLNAFITPSSTQVGNFKFYKCGRFVFCTMVTSTVTTNASGNVVINSSTTIIPSDYRPIENCEAVVSNLLTRCVFNKDGTIALPSYTSQTTTVRVSASWLSA